jgi:cytochrome P450
MRDAAERDVATWPVGRPFALLAHMRAITLDVILRAVFGMAAQDPDGAELRARIRALLEPTSNRLRLLLIAVSRGALGREGVDRRLAARVAAVDAVLFDLIARRRADPALAQREDICALLLQARDESGAPMTDREVRDELMTLLLAGHETTATALAWAFERLLRTPGVLAELRRSLADDGDDSYLDAVVKETLRVRPVVPNVARVLRAEHRVGPWTLPPGVTVAPSIVLTHGREDLYPAAREFRPERFLGDDPPDTYTWLPFGGGPRRCIGASFAMLEMRTVLRVVVERARLEAVGRRGEPARRTGVTLQPARGARVIQHRPPVAPERDAVHADMRAPTVTAR